MSNFLKSEKPEQTKFKSFAPYFSVEARNNGTYKGHTYPFCLPSEYAIENLYPEIQQPIMAYFARNEIKWHDGRNGKPSNHMCDSQVCCANFLYIFFDKPKALAELLRPIFPSLQELLPIEDGQYIAFEWIGQQNYLKEKISRNRKRTRGANFTSADAAVIFKCRDGHKQIALIEWKYTEAYYPTWLKYAASGADRTKTYEHLFKAPDCPLVEELIPDFDCLFFEPFYQLMRQQFLAHEMEKVHELGADIVSILHLSPAHNNDFSRVTSPDFRKIENSPTKVWHRLVKETDRFTSEYIENLFGNFNVSDFPNLSRWWQYLTTRYRWLKR